MIERRTANPQTEAYARKVETTALKMRRTLGLKPNDPLTAETMRQIHLLAARQETLSPYDIGHWFLREHLIEQLRKPQKLNEEDIHLLRQALGRLWIPESDEEYRRQIDAFRQLEEKPEWPRILQAFRLECDTHQAEQNRLKDLVSKAKNRKSAGRTAYLKTDDMFGNPHYNFKMIALKQPFSKFLEGAYETGKPW